ncbi:MAG TPA: YdeI/OmpD-associated family protein [Actinomycetota bacterium]|nr:YdeI/OmpD-associated family protein [Actinomycetota bacterium]
MGKKKVLEVELMDFGSGAGIDIPFDVQAFFGRKRVPVIGTINGAPYRSTIAVYGGKYYLGFTKKVRASAGGVGPGDKVRVVIEHDEAERTIEVPPDFAERMSKATRAFFDSLSYSHRREYVQWIEEAKKKETRDRRIAKAVEMLGEGSRTPK